MYAISIYATCHEGVERWYVYILDVDSAETATDLALKYAFERWPSSKGFTQHKAHVMEMHHVTTQSNQEW